VSFRGSATFDFPDELRRAIAGNPEAGSDVVVTRHARPTTAAASAKGAAHGIEQALDRCRCSHDRDRVLRRARCRRAPGPLEELRPVRRQRRATGSTSSSGRSTRPERRASGRGSTRRPGPCRVRRGKARSCSATPARRRSSRPSPGGPACSSARAATRCDRELDPRHRRRPHGHGRRDHRRGGRERAARQRGGGVPRLLAVPSHGVPAQRDGALRLSPDRCREPPPHPRRGRALARALAAETAPPPGRAPRSGCAASGRLAWSPRFSRTRRRWR